MAEQKTMKVAPHINIWTADNWRATSSSTANPAKGEFCRLVGKVIKYGTDGSTPVGIALASSKAGEEFLMCIAGEWEMEAATALATAALCYVASKTTVDDGTATNILAGRVIKAAAKGAKVKFGFNYSINLYGVVNIAGKGGTAVFAHA